VCLLILSLSKIFIKNLTSATNTTATVHTQQRNRYYITGADLPKDTLCVVKLTVLLGYPPVCSRC